MPQPSLPQNELNPTKRNENLNYQRQIYDYDYKYLDPLALLKELPAVENFSGQYIAERLLKTDEIVLNMLSAKAKSFLDPLDDLQDYEDLFTFLPLPEVAKVYQTNDSFAEQRLSGSNPLVIRLLDKNDPRSQILEQIPSFEAAFEPLFKVLEELESGNIYVTDYTGNDVNYLGPKSVQGGSHGKGQKYLPKPLAFFWWRRTGIGNNGKLVPIAIQLDASTNGRVYSPFEQNPFDWLFAKICVQIADGNHHEMNSHLCRTHFVMEPIAVGTARQLSENHPLNLLLKPHFLFMLANNHLGQQRLINLNGPVDQLLAGNLKESMELVKDAYNRWNIKEFAFPTEIKNRRMDDTERLPHYPYRDDGMLVWKAIYDFVSDYLNYFYSSPEDIIGDPELQAWAFELSDQTKGGKVKGMPTNFTDIQELIEIVTTVIFICGPQHSAVNFAQYEYMTFAANMPLAAYRDIPKQSQDRQDRQDRDQADQTSSVQTTTKEQTESDQATVVQATAEPDTLVEATSRKATVVRTTIVQIPEEQITEEQILKLLPPYKRTADQLQNLFVLSAYRFDRLGYYNKAFQELYHEKPEDIFNKDIIGIIRQFQQNLNMVEQEIDANNQKRVVPYPYLKPSLILNSISI